MNPFMNAKILTYKQRIRIRIFNDIVIVELFARCFEKAISIRTFFISSDDNRLRDFVPKSFPRTKELLKSPAGSELSSTWSPIEKQLASRRGNCRILGKVVSRGSP